MKVILLKDVPKLGQRFEIKEVKSGHALNKLIPNGDVAQATRSAMKNMEAQKSRMEGERKVHEDLIAMNIKDLDGITLTVSGKANEKGHLFAGFHREAIATELQKKTELQIDPSFINLDHPIKEIGEHTVEVKAGGKSAKFKLVIEAVK